MNAKRLFVHDCAAMRTTVTATKRVFCPQLPHGCFAILYPRVDVCGRGAPSPRRRFYHFAGERFFSSCMNKTNESISSTSLQGSAGGASFLHGLDIHTVQAEDDGHPLAVYTIRQSDNENNSDNGNGGGGNNKIPVLLLHGRTWSSLPVYHLIGESNESTTSGISSNSNREVAGEEAASGGLIGEEENNRSLFQALYNTRHIQPYAMDFRGFGGTPRSSSDPFVEPLRCVADAVSVLNWIRVRHHEAQKRGGASTTGPALLGWSHGALIAQITAQRHAELVSKLILYGSIYNPNVMNVISPHTDTFHTSTVGGGGHTDHDDFPLHEMAARNEYDGAMEDFISSGSGATRGNNNDEARIFPPVSARLFAKAALVCDPIKVQWKSLHQLNECQPSLVKVPTLVIAGDQDPYAPMSTQADLFTNLGRGVDKMWTIIANADHAVHLSDERHRFVENVNNFLRAI